METKLTFSYSEILYCKSFQTLAERLPTMQHGN